MSGLKVLTFEGTTNEATYNMTDYILEGATLILKQARVETTYTGDNYPRTINVKIDNSVTPTFVIDNDAGFNYFKVGLDQKLYTMADTTKRNISVTFPDTGFKMSGRINTNCNVTLLDSNHEPLTGLVYYFFQFVVV